MIHRRFVLVLVGAHLGLGCGGSNGDAGAGASTSASSGAGAGTGSGGGSGTGGCGPDTSAPNDVLGGGADPAMGMFDMTQALAGLPAGPGPLQAIIDTDLGTLTCTLRPDKAPNGVANFVGLARGLRPWLDPTTSMWVKRRFYDGLLFHRVIPMFVAQGGDPTGTGMGGPGYKFADEISDLTHVPGTLAYANMGPNTNGSQYYVTQTAQPTLDGKYTIFGLCTPVSVVAMLTGVPTDANDRPLTDLHMKTVTITQCGP
jgi:peptidyl-prolyl cis-trans isomerase A (cyclophilin A)